VTEPAHAVVVAPAAEVSASASQEQAAPDAVRPTPQPLPIAKTVDPQAAWEDFLRRFPAVERKAIARHAIRERADAIGRPFDLLLAQVVEVCDDEEAGKVKIQHSPLALASSRLRDGRGLKNGTLAKVREALGMRQPAAPARTPAPPPAPIPPPAPPPSVADLQAALHRAESSGQTAAAGQIRRSLERLHQESACAR
jgi:hypothetical protein